MTMLAIIEGMKTDADKMRAENEKLKKDVVTLKAALAVAPAVAQDESKISKLRQQVKELANENVDQEETITTCKQRLMS